MNKRKEKRDKTNHIANKKRATKEDKMICSLITEDYITHFIQASMHVLPK